jgi:hypothetical protein
MIPPATVANADGQREEKSTHLRPVLAIGYGMKKGKRTGLGTRVLEDGCTGTRNIRLRSTWIMIATGNGYNPS